MNKSVIIHVLFGAVLFCALNVTCNSQVVSKHAENDKLALDSKIPLPKLHGRIDHLTYDSANHLVFIAALGNNTVEVVNTEAKQLVHTISNLHEPQGIGYVPSLKKIVVANGGNGDCIFFDATTYARSDIVHLRGDADNVRYEPIAQLLYMGYGRY